MPLDDAKLAATAGNESGGGAWGMADAFLCRATDAFKAFSTPATLLKRGLAAPRRPPPEPDDEKVYGFGNFLRRAHNDSPKADPSCWIANWKPPLSAFFSFDGSAKSFETLPAFSDQLSFIVAFCVPFVSFLSFAVLSFLVDCRHAACPSMHSRQKFSCHNQSNFFVTKHSKMVCTYTYSRTIDT